MHFEKVTIVGVGLLGGSLGLAIRKHRLAGKTVGYVRRAATIAECRRVRAVDEATRDLRAAVAGADLVILCTPICRMRPLLEEMLPALKRGAIITDVGSVKGCVVKELELLAARAGARFVGGHPMAGAEKNGVKAARADLFVNAVCVLTPTRRTDRAALSQVGRFWKALGGRLLRLTPEQHDVLVSRSSHLPHVAAATLANLVLDPRRPRQQALLCANGFRDTTRIASGSPEMWRDIAVTNRRNLAAAIGEFIKDLEKLRAALKRSDTAAVSEFFEQGRRRRGRWCTKVASPSPE